MPDLNNRTAYPLTRVATPIRVWTRVTWTDAWTLRPDLQCTQLVWSSYPEVSTASLHYRYGFVMQPGQSAPTIHTPITARGYWVLVAMDTDDGPPAVWLGYAENPITRPLTAASDTSPATGDQTIPCYGLERIWDHCYVESTVCLTEEETDEEPNRFARRGNVAAVFNGPDHTGYRSRQFGTLDDERDWTAAGFARPTDDGRHVWNTADIVQHLLGFHAPTASRILATNPDPAVEIPWQITGIGNLPGYDTPTIDTAGRSIGDILRSIITPGRMLGLTFSAAATIPAHGSDDSPLVTAVTMAFATRLTQPTTIPDIGPLPYDPTGVTLACATDPLTTVDYRLDDSDVVDQIIVQGPREISVCTIEHSETQWQNDWDEDDADDYDIGGSETDGWDDLTNSQRRDLNADKRENALSHRRTYRNLRLGDSFDGKVRGGKSMFPDASTGGNATGEDLHVPHLDNVEILPDLPLYDGVDYMGAADEVDETEGSRTRLPILTSFEIPGSADARIHSSVMAGLGVFFSSQFRVFRTDIRPNNERGPGIEMNVIGAPQYMLIDPANGTPNAADGVLLTAYDHTTIETTVAVRGDRRPFWAQPAELPPLDVIRRRVYTYEDPPLQQVYIVPDTVLAITGPGIRTLADGGMLRNPLPRLRALANLIATYAHAPRYRVQIQTARILSTLPVGANLRTVDVIGTDVQSPIVEIRIDAPLAETIDRTDITLTITAASHRFDVLSLL